MTESEGVIQYQLEYQCGKLPLEADIQGLFRWFSRCRELDLIGQDLQRYDGFAYGNISVRSRPGFVISGTQTGGKESLSPEDLAWVEDFDAARNWLKASGPARPSSEAMTHGQIYQLRPQINAVIHVHSPLIWRSAQALELPVTATEAAYGTPEMAAEVARLLASPLLEHDGIFAMGGHEDGVVTFGRDMQTSGELLLDALTRAQTL